MVASENSKKNHDKLNKLLGRQGSLAERFKLARELNIDQLQIAASAGISQAKEELKRRRHESLLAAKRQFTSQGEGEEKEKGSMNQKTELLEKIANQFINDGVPPERDRFRAKNPNFLDVLDEMETEKSLKIEDGRYTIPLLKLEESRFWESEKKIIDKILQRLRELYQDDPKENRSIDLLRPQNESELSDKDIQRALHYLVEAGFTRGSQKDHKIGSFLGVYPHEDVLRYSNIEDKIEKDRQCREESMKHQLPVPSQGGHHLSKMGDSLEFTTFQEGNPWAEIKTAYSVSKVQFCRRIRFVKDRFRREIISRDVSHAHGCLKRGFYKPAVILAGGVIEELLRLYLDHKGHPVTSGSFSDYIQACIRHKLLKSAITQLSDAVRNFRNLVHLKEESSQRYSISKTTAASAVNAIFTVINDFQLP